MPKKPTYEELKHQVKVLEKMLVEYEFSEEKILKNIVLGVSLKYGKKFFNALVIELSKAMGVEYTFIGELSKDQKHITTISLCFAGELKDNFSYELGGTPCETVVGKKICSYASGVADKFPDDELLKEMAVEGYVGVPLQDSNNTPLGVIVALSQKPLKNPQFQESVLQLFALRAAAEIERKKTESSLKNNERRFRTLLANIPTGIFRTNPEGELLYANSAMVKMFGCDSVEEFKQHFDTGNDKRPERRQDLLAALESEGKIEKFKIKREKKDGKIFIGSLSSTKGFNRDGDFDFIDCILEDISDQNRAEEALKDSEAFTRAILDNLPVGIAVKTGDPTVKFEYMNDNFPKFYRTSKEALAAPDAFWDSVYEDPEFRKEIKKRILEDCASGDPERMYWVDVPITRKGSETCFITARNIPLPDSPLIISTVWDVSERKKMEARLQQSQKMEAIGTLAGGIAHDFNNILSVIVGYSEIAISDVGDDSKTAGYIRQVLKAGKTASGLVKQILAFSSINRIKAQPVQVRMVTREVIKLLRATLPATIEIKQSLQSQNMVMADSTQLYQVLMNLCTNAAHAMQTTGGILDIALTDTEVFPEGACEDQNLKPGYYVKLAISDTGHGISPEITEKIFDPFFTTKGRTEGTGMGLSVVHGIIKNHQGGITVCSELGKGSIFNVFLPMLDSQETGTETKQLKLTRGGTERILLVDDENELVIAGKLILESLGYTVTTKTKSPEALALFKKQPDNFDVVITDMTMPKMTGDKLSVEILKIRPDIPIILCTGFSMLMDNEKAKSIGIRDFIMKPIRKKDIAAAIRNVLDEK